MQLRKVVSIEISAGIRPRTKETENLSLTMCHPTTN